MQSNWLRFVLTLFVVLMLLLGDSLARKHAVISAQQANVTAFVGVQLIPLDEERVSTSQTLLVRDGVIAELGDSATIAIPDNAQVVYACAQYLLPGLIDMHVHVRPNDLPLYLASGVTTVRHMWGYPALRETIRRINDGELIGPTIYSAGPGIDGSGSTVPAPIILEDPAQAEALIAQQVREGWDFIKVYQELKLPVYQAILAAAQRQGLKAVGHVPTRVSIEDALAAGQSSIEHLTGYDVALNQAGSFWGVRAWIEIDRAKIPDLVRRTQEAGAWNCPTLSIFDLLARRFASPDERELIIQHRRLLVKALHDAGARLLAGTDAGINETVPGTGLHEELAELVAAGLSPYAALRTATLNAAEFLGRADQIGSIAVGKRADLILVQANPLEDIRALATIKGVMLRGRLLQPPPVRSIPCRPPLRRAADGRKIEP